MLATLKSTILEILDSKKALAVIALLLARLGTAIAGWCGLSFDQDAFDHTFDRAVVLVTAYVAAQGYADHGTAIAAGNVKVAAIAAEAPKLLANAATGATVVTPPGA